MNPEREGVQEDSCGNRGDRDSESPVTLRDSSSSHQNPMATPPASDAIYPSPTLRQDRGTPEATIDTVEQVLGYFNEYTDALASFGKMLANQELLDDPLAIARSWAAFPEPFLDRLLSAANYKPDPSVTDPGLLNVRIIDRDFQVSYGVRLIYLFVELLPAASRDDEKLARMIGRLLNAPPLASQARLQILEVLLRLASTHHGSAALLEAPDWTRFVPFTADYEDGLKIFEYACAIAALEAVDIKTQPLKLHDIIYSLVNAPQPADTTPLFQCIVNIVRFIPKETSSPPNWLGLMVRLLLRSITASSFDSTENRRAVVHVTAALIRTYPIHFPITLFSSELKDDSSPTSKPLCWLFIHHQLDDIRAWISSSAGKLDSPEYLRNSTHVAAESYDILSAFIGFLVQMDDRRGPDGGLQAFHDPNVLHSVQKDLSSTCSMTIKQLCERYKAATAGTSLIEVSTGASNPGSSRMREDPLILAQLRVLALWLREDNGDEIHHEAVGIMDLLLGLYCQQDEVRWPILTILEQLILDEDNIDHFLDQKGWETVVYDFRSIIESPSACGVSLGCAEVIVDLLAPVVRHIIKSRAVSKYGMDMVGVACSLDSKGSCDVLEVKCAALFLAVQLYLKIPADTKGKWKALKQLVKIPEMLLKASDELDEATKDELEDAMETLGRLQVNGAQMMVANLSLS
ncbi:MAG: hypothetical protein Q9196_005478 [Gyalolechia fulgens]